MYVIQGCKQEVIKIVSLCKNDRKTSWYNNLAQPLLFGWHFYKGNKVEEILFAFIVCECLFHAELPLMKRMFPREQVLSVKVYGYTSIFSCHVF